jgi:acyl carrier protein
MDEVQMRLTKCFETVFPTLQTSEIPGCSQHTVTMWDSIATITLVNVVEDEFAFQVDFDLVSEFSSFDSILSYVKTQVEK